MVSILCNFLKRRVGINNKKVMYIPKHKKHMKLSSNRKKIQSIYFENCKSSQVSRIFPDISYLIIDDKNLLNRQNGFSKNYPFRLKKVIDMVLDKNGEKKNTLVKSAPNT
ncbi:hypothetical protein BpHYR1_027226 [Brachionus plicatilis]|uniref:Uncharacterized protein n=1 Tax=Brachionus plicatilis TaxID=10195 RepID=A0A3M7T7Y6_BRAPC|nr:hypothetical protein BpHYR1_027226 [Brachionus plicatilis]